MRVAGYSLLALLVLALAPPAGLAGELRIAAWNLEHLDDTRGEGCVGRSGADYTALARRIEELDVRVVALQEVENTEAAPRFSRCPTGMSRCPDARRWIEAGPAGGGRRRNLAIWRRVSRSAGESRIGATAT